MRVSWDEFTETCKFLQKKSALPGLPKTEAQRAGIWRALDEDCGGWIALREFDQDSFECISQFKLWASQHHGQCSTAFQVLTSGTGGKLTEKELERIDMNSKLFIQGLNTNNNSTVHHREEKGKKISWEVPFLVEKDVRFLDKWDLEG